MLICDTHADTLWRMACSDAAESDMQIRRRHLTASPENTWVQALALFVSTGGMETRPTVVEKELAAFEQLKQQGWRQVTSLREARAGEANMLLTLEGCEAFGGDIDQVERFARLGVRIAALTWNNPNGLCQPACADSGEGLTPLGRDVVVEMRRQHMAVDVSHLNVRGFFDLLDSTVPPMASHSCAYALCPHCRNLTDDQLRALFQAGGYVGVNFYTRFLSMDGRANLDTVIDHMAHMCELGGEKHIGLGSDFDGIDQAPQGLQNAGDMPSLFARMTERGFGKTLVEDIAGHNFERYLERL